MIPEIGATPGAFLSQTGNDSKKFYFATQKNGVLQAKIQLMDAGKW